MRNAHSARPGPQKQVEQGGPTKDEVSGNDQAQIVQPSPYEIRELRAQEDMALWSMLMFFAALVTVLVTSVGTYLIWRQVRLTRKAVIDTGEATQAMRDANAIARETMQKQLRAYLTVEPHGVNEADGGNVRVPLLVRNVGETPAHKVMVFSKFGLEENPASFDPASLEAPDSWLVGEIHDATYGRGVERYLFAYVVAELIAPYEADIRDKKLALVHWGHIIYEDVFWEEHRTHFAFYHWGDLLSDETSLRCRFGNTAD